MSVAFGPGRKDRLFLFGERISGEARDGGYDFHSLVWEREGESGWNVHLTLSRKQFDCDTARRRWVSDVHSLDPEHGTATLQVAEESAPVGLLVTVVKIQYSWREWDLINNVEIRHLKNCASPFDPLDR